MPEIKFVFLKLLLHPKSIRAESGEVLPDVSRHMKTNNSGMIACSMMCVRVPGSTAVHLR